GDALFRERKAERLQHTALDLRPRGRGIDDAPDVVHGDDVLDRDLPGLNVDLDIREMRPERAQREIRIVRMATAFPDHGVVIDLCQDLREWRARALRHDDAGFEAQLGHRGFENAGRGPEELLARVAGRETHRGADRGGRQRSRRYRPVGVVGVAEPDMHVLELDAELVRADLREDRARPGADVLAAACEHD